MTESSDLSLLRAPIDEAPPRQEDPYSRFVATAKWLLPLIAVCLLALVALWPRLEVSIQQLAAMPKLDPRMAHDLRMLKARYTGVDRDNRPYVLTADAAQQQSADINDLIGLDGPTADLTMQDGGWLELNSFTGTYRPQGQILELFGNVAIYADRGDEFHSDSAHIDLVNNAAEGHDPVTGQGPFGHVVADGFQILDKGDTIIFTGHATLELEPRAQQKAVP
jgi:lipopolysaccharide export system protein LptC